MATVPRAQQEINSLRREELSYASQLSNVENRILDTLNRKKMVDLEEYNLTRKTADIRETEAQLIEGVKDDMRSLATTMSEYLGASRKNIPFQEKLVSMQHELSTLEGLGLQHLTNAQSARAHDLAILIPQTRQLQEQAIQFEAIKSATEGITEALGLQAGTLTKIGSTVQKFLLSPWILIVGLLGLAVAKFIKMQGVAEDFRKNTGLTLMQSEGIELTARKTFESQRQIGVTYEDALKSAEALYKVLGNMSLVTQENVDLVSEMAARLGVSVDDSAKFVGTLSLIGKSADDIKSIGKNMEALAYGYGVSVKDLMSDVASATGDAYEYLQKYPAEFVVTAAKARSLGFDMKKVSDITKGLLDIETSLGDEMEANILTGKNINLDAARYYALIGDTGKSLDSMLGQLGSVAEFQKLAPLAQQSLAKAVNMTTEELGKALAKRHDELTMSADQKKLLEAQRTEQNRIAGVLTQTKQSFEAIVSDLASIFLPVLEAVKPIIGFVASMFRSIHDVVTTWPGWLKETVRYLGAALLLTVAIAKTDVIGKVGGLFGKVKGMFGMGKGAVGGGGQLDLFGKGAEKSVPTGGGMFRGMGEFIKGISPTQMLAGGAAMIMIAGAVWILAKAMQEFSTGVTWDGVGKGIIAMGALVGAVALLGAIMTSGIGTIAILAGAAAILVIAGAMWVLGDAMQKIASSSTGIDDLFKTLMMVDPVRLVAIGGALAAVGTGLSAMAIGGLAAGVVNTIFGNVGGAGGGATKKDKMDIVIDKLDTLNETLKGKDFSVNMDGRKMNKQLAVAGNYGV